MKRAVALLLALFLLCGCGAQTETPAAEQTPADAPAPVTQALSTFGMAFEPDGGWDPYNCRSVYNRLVLELVYEPLFTVAADGTVNPLLASGWSVSEDGLTTTVTLRDDVKFHNGAKLTASDVVRSVDLASEGAYYADRFSLLADVEAVNAATVRFTTQKPYECFPLLLDIPIVGRSANADAANGTGAYMLRRGALRRFPDWHGDASATPDTVALVSVSSGEALRDAFQFGGVSITAQDPNSDQPLYFGGDYEIWDVPTSTLQFIGFNLRGVFASGGLRAAVTYAVDREAIVTEDMEGYGIATALPARPGTPWYSGALADDISYDPSRLRELAPAGVRAVMIVCGDNPQRSASAQRVADALKSCGLTVELRELGAKEYAAALESGAYDLCYGEIRLSPNFELAPLLRAVTAGLSDAESLETLCDLTRANSGNAYDLQKAVLTDGLLCPVAFKTAAIYSKRTLPLSITPHLNGWAFPTE